MSKKKAIIIILLGFELAVLVFILLMNAQLLRDNYRVVSIAVPDDTSIQSAQTAKVI